MLPLLIRFCSVFTFRWRQAFNFDSFDVNTMSTSMKMCVWMCLKAPHLRLLFEINILKGKWNQSASQKPVWLTRIQICTSQDTKLQIINSTSRRTHINTEIFPDKMFCLYELYWFIYTSSISFIYSGLDTVTPWPVLIQNQFSKMWFPLDMLWNRQEVRPIANPHDTTQKISDNPSGGFELLIPIFEMCKTILY